MVYNDVMALGLINQLAQYGVPVPNDLTVVGYDDIEFAAMANPALTTVRVPREEAGAGHVLPQRTADGDGPRSGARLN